jgi:hypothetical protein
MKGPLYAHYNFVAATAGLAWLFFAALNCKVILWGVRCTPMVVRKIRQYHKYVFDHLDLSLRSQWRRSPFHYEDSNIKFNMAKMLAFMNLQFSYWIVRRVETAFVPVCLVCFFFVQFLSGFWLHDIICPRFGEGVVGVCEVLLSLADGRFVSVQ